MSALRSTTVRQYRTDRQLQADMIDGAFSALIEGVSKLETTLSHATIAAAGIISGSFRRGGKLLACGNGGSAAAAQHFVGEMVGRFRDARRTGLRAIALTADSAVLTGWSNDTGYEDVFARQVETFGQAGDVLVCVSTSGQSPNLIRACSKAGRAGLSCIAILGELEGDLAGEADIVIAAPAGDAQRAQELHLFILHLISDLIEAEVCGGPGPFRA